VLFEVRNFREVIVFCVWEKDGATVKWAGLSRHVGLVAIALTSRVRHLILDFRGKAIGVYLRQVHSAISY
jgi:hypothetical protein